MGPGQPGLPGPSAAETAAEAFGTGSVFATTQNPSMGACHALARPWNSRSATFYPVQVSGSQCEKDWEGRVPLRTESQ